MAKNASRSVVPVHYICDLWHTEDLLSTGRLNKNFRGFKTRYSVQVRQLVFATINTLRTH